MKLLRQIAARLPSRWQIELKRIYYARQIRSGTFVSEEPEYSLLEKLVNPGDWVVDVGANVGHYTKRLSDLVGTRGRVIALEPVPTTFALLSANAQLFSHSNVTLINAAASNKLDVVGMSIPSSPNGLSNYYQASLDPVAESPFSVLTISIDSLLSDKTVALIKIDVEGHEALALAGMQQAIQTHHPILIVETGNKNVISSLTSLGYRVERLPNSPNILFRANR